jgi:Zn finger protein HypA/HybF involved in hydrogenase expression
MHEIGIAQDLSVIVLETAKREKLSRVTKVNVSIEIIPVKMKCIDCGNDFQVIDNRFECAVCGSTELRIIQGKELFVKSIEGE